MLYLFSVVVFFSLSSTTVYAQSIVISEVRANCIKQVTGLDAYINDRLRIYPSVHEQAIFDCVQKAEAARPTKQKSETRAIDNKNSKPQSSPSTGNAVGKPSVDADSQKAALEIRKSESSNPDMKFIDDVENFFRNGGSVDVVTFVPLLQKAKQEAGEPQITNKTAVNALRTYLETNQAFKTYYAELNSRRNETIKRERESLLATVKYAEKPFTDYIRQNLNAQNINQYLDAIKLISSANIDTPAEDLKIIISKLSSLNSELMKLTSQQSQNFNQKIADINDIKVDNSTLSSLLPDGHYANSEADCEAFRKDPTEDAVYGLIVRGKSIGYTHAGGCDITKFRPIGENAALVSATCGEEGVSRKLTTKIIVAGKSFDFDKLSGGGDRKHIYCGNLQKKQSSMTQSNANASITGDTQKHLDKQLKILERIVKKKSQVTCVAYFIKSVNPWISYATKDPKEYILAEFNVDLKYDNGPVLEATRSKVGDSIIILNTQNGIEPIKTLSGKLMFFLTEYRVHDWPLEALSIDENSCRPFRG